MFPAPRSGKPVNTFSDIKRAIDEASRIPDFVWHDFRRSFVTALAEAGVPETVADAILNHRQSATRSGVRAAYNHAALTTQKVAIMSAWGELVAHAVEYGAWPREGKAPGNVVPLRAAAG